MTPFGGVLGLVFADADAGRVAAAAAVAPSGMGGQVGMGVDVVGGLVRLREDQVFGRAAQDGVGALLVFGQYEQPAPAMLLIRMSRICAAVSPPVSRST